PQGELSGMQLSGDHLDPILVRIPFLSSDSAGAPKRISTDKIFIGKIESRLSPVELRLTLHLRCLGGFYGGFSLGQGASIEESRHLGFDNRQHSLTAFHRRAGAWLNPSKKPCHRRRDHITVTDT